MTKIKRFCVLNETHSGDNCFLCHRGYPMGNPYTHIKNKNTKAFIVVKNREEAIRRYGSYFELSLKMNSDFKNAFGKMVQACLTNTEVWLGCYCAENETCHVDYIIKRLRQECTKRMFKKILPQKPTDNKDV